MNELEIRAKKMSDTFLESEKEYRLGFVEAEKSNQKTVALGETFVKNTEDGVKMLLDVDNDLCGLFEKTLQSDKFDMLLGDFLAALKSGGRIVISGCGSTGRLAMRIEASFRIAVKEAAKKNKDAEKYIDKVISLMTGGDYAIIRAVESFEDYISLGKMQARELDLGERDVLVGVTATGETTSILGTASQALDDGAKVWMVVCTQPESIIGKLKRADDVYTHKNCSSIYMNCGGMAVTGSTRMQSSTIEQAVISSALELALAQLLGNGKGVDKKYLADGFKEMIKLLKEDETVKLIAQQTDREKELYESGGKVTYFANEYLLDVLADTTERGPTFSVPAFRPQSRTDLPLSLAFVKNPSADTKTAWSLCFERTPRCIDKTREDYEKIGIKAEDIAKIPKIDLEALYEFQIGNEQDAEREGKGSLATWISFDEDAPEEFEGAAKRFENKCVFKIGGCDKKLRDTRMKIFTHLCVKLAVNAFSTGTMAKMGRIRGNYMVYINITNKKLVDRASRIVSDLCSVSYEKANYELFLSKLMLEEKNIEGKAAIETIERLKGGK